MGGGGRVGKRERAMTSSDMVGELPGDVDGVLDVEGEGGAGTDPGVVEQGGADLIHHLLQHNQSVTELVFMNMGEIPLFGNPEVKFIGVSPALKYWMKTLFCYPQICF